MMRRLPPLERIHRGPVLNLLVLGRADIQTVMPEVPYSVISITDPNSPDAVLADSPLRHDVLRLKFHDIGDGTPFGDYTAMTDAEAQTIISFAAEQSSHIELLVCQCEAGASRSAGIAAALSRLMQNEDAYFFRNYTPNLRVYDALLRVGAASDGNQQHK